MHLNFFLAIFFKINYHKNRSEISIEICVFDTNLFFFKDIFLWGPISTYFTETLDANSLALEQNMERNFFLQTGL